MSEKLKRVIPAAATVSMIPMMAFASEANMGQQVVQALEPLKTQFTAAVAVIAAGALAIHVAPMAWKLGIKFLRSIVKA